MSREGVLHAGILPEVVRRRQAAAAFLALNPDPSPHFAVNLTLPPFLYHSE